MLHMQVSCTFSTRRMANRGRLIAECIDEVGGTGARNVDSETWNSKLITLTLTKVSALNILPILFPNRPSEGRHGYPSFKQQLT